MAQFKRIGLVGRLGHAATLDSLRRLVDFLEQRDLDIILDEGTARSLPAAHRHAVCRRDLMGSECDLIIVVGGDGSMLGVARIMADQHVPVIGVNRGRLGFLTDILPEEIEDALARVLDGEFTEEKRFLIEFSVQRDGQLHAGSCALNDVVLHPGTAAQMIEFELFVDEQFVNSQQSDGLIVATPTGSTAYSLSAGGPIMHPALNALAVVPMYPHSLSSRPLVIDADSTVRIVVVEQRSLLPLVSCDGAVQFTTEPGDEIIIRKKAEPLRLIHPPEHNYYQTCRSKLGWGNRLIRDEE